MERQNHKDSFLHGKTREWKKKIIGRREDVLIIKRRITVLLQVIGCLIIFSSPAVGGEGVFIQVER